MQFSSLFFNFQSLSRESLYSSPTLCLSLSTYLNPKSPCYFFFLICIFSCSVPPALYFFKNLHLVFIFAKHILRFYLPFPSLLLSLSFSCLNFLYDTFPCLFSTSYHLHLFLCHISLNLSLDIFQKFPLSSHKFFSSLCVFPSPSLSSPLPPLLFSISSPIPLVLSL